MIPRRREEKRKREERARGMKHLASDLGTLGYCIPKLTESRAHQSASLVPLCFAQKQAVGIVSDSSTLRDGSRLDLRDVGLAAADGAIPPEKRLPAPG